VGEGGQQDCLGKELVDCFNDKPSIVNVGKQIMPAGTACIKLGIMLVSGQLSWTVMKLIVCNLYSLNSGSTDPFLFFV
jgi:hypothetical protein